jgi:hypothetical protein
VRAELGAAPDACVVVVVSRLVRHKGHPELLRAMEDVPGAELWVVGDRLPTDHGEPLEPYFERAEAALGPRLRRLGYRHDVARLLAASDVFALPSHFEGLPMSVIEAMLTGLPVVATDVRGAAGAGGGRRNRLPGAALRVGAAGGRAAAAGGGPGAARAHGRGRAGAGAGALHGGKVVARTLDLLGL